VNVGCICKRNTKHSFEVNHVLHLLISIFVIGLWVPVWAYLNYTTEYTCDRCGSEFEDFDDEEPKSNAPSAWDDD
jgi:hypothetical protein